MVEVVSMLELSAVAVDREMVGRDSEAELIGGEIVLESYPTVPAFTTADEVCCSVLDFGFVENIWLRRFCLVAAFTAIPALEAENDGESLEDEFADRRRGIAEDGNRRTSQFKDPRIARIRRSPNSLADPR